MDGLSQHCRTSCEKVHSLFVGIDVVWLESMVNCMVSGTDIVRGNLRTVRSMYRTRNRSAPDPRAWHLLPLKNFRDLQRHTATTIPTQQTSNLQPHSNPISHKPPQTPWTPPPTSPSPISTPNLKPSSSNSSSKRKTKQSYGLVPPAHNFKCHYS